MVPEINIATETILPINNDFEIPSRIYSFSNWKTGNLNPRKTIISPAYKITNGKVYLKKHTDSNWSLSPNNEMYFLHEILLDEILTYDVKIIISPAIPAVPPSGSNPGSPAVPEESSTTTYNIQDISFSFIKYKINETLNIMEIGIEPLSYIAPSLLIDNGSNNPLTNDSRFSINLDLVSDIGYTALAKKCTSWVEYEHDKIYIKKKQVLIGKKICMMKI
jgi:hypothetical protein